MDQGERPNLSRRGFLGLLAGLAATPIIKPKRSFFFFEGPKEILVPKDESFHIQSLIDKLGPQGGIIRFPEGTWIMNQGFFIPENVSLKGDGHLNVVGCNIKIDSKRKDGAMFGDKEAAIIVPDGSLVTGCALQGVGDGNLAMLRVSV